MATNQTSKTPAVKTEKVKKTPPTAVQRINDIMKRAALQGRITVDELDVVANLAAALKTFIKA